MMVKLVRSYLANRTNTPGKPIPIGKQNDLQLFTKATEYRNKSSLFLTSGLIIKCPPVVSCS